MTLVEVWIHVFGLSWLLGGVVLAMCGAAALVSADCRGLVGPVIWLGGIWLGVSACTGVWSVTGLPESFVLRTVCTFSVIGVAILLLCGGYAAWTARCSRLHRAVARGDVPEIRRLLKAGFSPDIPDGDGRTAFDCLPAAGGPAILRLLNGEDPERWRAAQARARAGLHPELAAERAKQDGTA